MKIKILDNDSFYHSLILHFHFFGGRGGGGGVGERVKIYWKSKRRIIKNYSRRKKLFSAIFGYFLKLFGNALYHLGYSPQRCSYRNPLRPWGLSVWSIFDFVTQSFSIFMLTFIRRFSRSKDLEAAWDKKWMLTLIDFLQLWIMTILSFIKKMVQRFILGGSANWWLLIFAWSHVSKTFC